MPFKGLLAYFTIFLMPKVFLAIYYKYIRYAHTFTVYRSSLKFKLL